MNEQQSKIIDKILKEMATGAVPWQSSFFTLGKWNLLSGHAYKGMNHFILTTNKSLYYRPYKMKLIKEREVEVQKNQLNMLIERFLSATKAKIKHNDLSQACYTPSFDIINLPDIGQFPNTNTYYNAALHELIHWTAHPTRLNRLTSQAEKDTQSKEELIAEIGSSFLSQEFGIENIERTSSYCELWMPALGNNKSWLFHSANQAEKAVKYLKELVM